MAGLPDPAVTWIPRTRRCKIQAHSSWSRKNGTKQSGSGSEFCTKYQELWDRRFAETLLRVPDKMHTDFEAHNFWNLSKDTQVKRGFMAIVAAAVCGVATWGGKRWDRLIFPTPNPLMIEFQWSPPVCFLKTHRGTVCTPNSPCKFRSVEGVTMPVWFPSEDFKDPGGIMVR